MIFHEYAGVRFRSGDKLAMTFNDPDFGTVVQVEWLVPENYDPYGSVVLNMGNLSDVDGNIIPDYRVIVDFDSITAGDRVIKADLVSNGYGLLIEGNAGIFPTTIKVIEKNKSSIDLSRVVTVSKQRIAIGDTVYLTNEAKTILIKMVVTEKSAVANLAFIIPSVGGNNILIDLREGTDKMLLGVNP
jgi:hypothetical protein